MKPQLSSLILLLLIAGAVPTNAQYGSQANSGYSCWQCPVCGYVVSMTQAEAASVNPYTPCPVCNSAYAGYFVPVSCPAGQGKSASDNSGLNPGYEIVKSDSGTNESETTPADSLSVPLATTKGKILMVLPYQQYQEDELNVPRAYFQSRGYAVMLASKGVETATGMSGENAAIDLDLKDVKVSDYVAVVFVGGEGIYNLKLNDDSGYQALARAAIAQKKLTGAICLGPWILADAGLLKGKKATASETDHLKARGAFVSDEAVVRDGNIITGNGPSAAQEFAEAIVAALEESDSGATNDDDGGREGISAAEMSAALTIPVSTGDAGTAPSPTAAKWKCTVCGYIYDPAEHDNVPFEQLPSTWKCPCGAPRSKFVKT